MPDARRGCSPGVFVAANDGSKPLAVMRHAERREAVSLMSRESAHRLIRAWVYTEVADSYAECGYPSSAAVVGEYVPHRDDEREEAQAREVDRSQNAEERAADIQRAGWIIQHGWGSKSREWETAHLLYYREVSVPKENRLAMLDRFRRDWAAWSAEVDGPLNPL